MINPPPKKKKRLNEKMKDIQLIKKFLLTFTSDFELTLYFFFTIIMGLRNQ